MDRRALRTAVTAVIVGALALVGCAEAADTPTTAPTTGTVADSTAPPASPEASAPDETTTPPSAPPDVDQDPELAALLAELIVEDLPPVSMVSSDDIARDCGTDAGGCWAGAEDTIYVTSEWTDFRRTEILAHEYLHHVWERDGLDDDAELAAALDEAYADEEGLGALVPTWRDDYVEPDGSIMPTELFSYACTGLRAEQLAPPVRERCEQYLRMEAMPVAQTVDVGALLDQVDALREADGLDPLERNPHATAASEARAALFTPESQVPLDEYPQSVKKHLDAGCAPARYGARLTRPGAPEQMVADLDALLEGALTSTEFSGIGMATTRFDHIDARELFGERTLRANATLVVVTVCG